MKRRTNQRAALVSIATAILAISSAEFSTALAATNRVGTVTISYTMTASGSGSGYADNINDGTTDNPIWCNLTWSDGEDLWMSVQHKYAVLFDGTNLSVGDIISSNAVETASGFYSEGDSCDGGVNDTFEPDPNFSPPQLGFWPVNATNQAPGSGTFKAVFFLVPYGVTQNGAFFAYEEGPGVPGGTWPHGADWEILGEDAVLYAQNQVSQFQFQIPNGGAQFQQSWGTNYSVVPYSFSGAGPSGDTANGSAALSATIKYVPDRQTVTFTAAPTNGLVPLAVQFNASDHDNGGNLVTNWAWDFGDGTTTNYQNPLHTYTNTPTLTNAGTYTVTLTATNTNGAPVQGAGPGSIAVALPTLQFTAVPTNGYMPLAVHFSTPLQDSGANTIVNWSWDFGDGNTSDSPDVWNTYSVTMYGTDKATLKPSLTVTNQWGTAIQATGPSIKLLYPPIAFLASPTNGPIPLPVQFTAPSMDGFCVPITNWSWSFGDGATAACQNPLHVYTNHGTFYVLLKAKNSNAVPVYGAGTIQAGWSNVHTFGQGGVGYDPGLMGAATNSDGTRPQAGLALSGQRLYGVMSGGGNYGSGTVFSVNTNGAGLTNLHQFSALLMEMNSDGAWPKARLALSSNGVLYGATSTGGGSSPMGGGTLFKINTDGTGFRTLISFTTATSTNGSRPNGLTLSGDTLYGTAGGGGSNYDGTVFKLDSSGSNFTVLHDFSATSYNGTGGWTNGDGSEPSGPLLLAGNTLYGVTDQGGTGCSGTIFAINTNGTGFTNLHEFTATVSGTNADGAKPEGGLVLAGGRLYGTAYQGGLAGNGTVFGLNPDGSDFIVIHSFSPGANDAAGNYINSDGTQPSGELAVSGSLLYGATRSGGAGGAGTIFALCTNGAGFLSLYSFTEPAYDSDLFCSTNLDGANPYGDLVLADGSVYGTACNGGMAGQGTLFTMSLVASPPMLQLQWLGAGGLVISWPSGGTNWSLEQCANLGMGSWAACPGTVCDDGTNKNVSIVPAGSSLFFRLRGN